MAASSVLATITVTDDSGETVVLSTPARKIVSLSPHITEILFELGVGDRIVGTVRYSDYPPAARDIPRVGDAFSVNVESVVNIEPDIVFAWATGGADKALNQLQTLRVPVYIDHARNLESIADSVRRMARLVGKPERGEELAGGYLESLNSIDEKHRSEQRTRVFFQISDRDLYTVSRSHFMGQAIELCGGENLFAESSVPIPKVSQEAVLAADPDVIIISQPDQNNESPWIKKWNAHESLNGKVKVINSDLISRPSLRMLDGIKSLCGLMKMP
ncbi:MAG: cobalamin-binding protein [Pseudomonadales bacterium]